MPNGRAKALGRSAGLRQQAGQPRQAGMAHKASRHHPIQMGCDTGCTECGPAQAPRGQKTALHGTARGPTMAATAPDAARSTAKINATPQATNLSAQGGCNRADPPTATDLPQICRPEGHGPSTGVGRRSSVLQVSFSARSALGIQQTPENLHVHRRTVVTLMSF